MIEGVNLIKVMCIYIYIYIYRKAKHALSGWLPVRGGMVNGEGEGE
jgi:hypothetical protein